MAGIYIHVPYCKTRCIYCDFFTQVDMSQRSQYVDAVCKEIVLRKNYIGDESVETIYCGGGTPSQLSQKEFELLFQTLYDNFKLSDNPEITFEANPDDLTTEYIKMLRSLPFNRVSLGVQTFNDKFLKFLNRRHDAQKAKNSIIELQNNSFENISIDLIYGLPKQSVEMLVSDLEFINYVNIPHLSAYHLIYEEGTELYKLMQNHNVIPVQEDVSLELFSTLIETLDKYNYIHYEISNFGKEGYFSKHNTSYWQGNKYLGLGPAAHSYDGENRSYNIPSISKYVDSVGKGDLSFMTIEYLDEKEKYNEYILTGMRTMWGVDLDKLNKLFGNEMLNYCLKNINPYIERGLIKQQENKLILNRQGIFVSDGIMSDLMWV